MQLLKRYWTPIHLLPTPAPANSFISHSLHITVFHEAVLKFYFIVVFTKAGTYSAYRQ